MNNKHLFSQPGTEAFLDQRPMGPRKEWYCPFEGTWELTRMDMNTGKGGARK